MSLDDEIAAARAASQQANAQYSAGNYSAMLPQQPAAAPSGPDLGSMSSSELAGSVNPNVTPGAAGPAVTPPALPQPRPEQHLSKPLGQAATPPSPSPENFLQTKTDTQTSTSSTHGSSGLSAEAAARQGKRLDAVGAAQSKATDDAAAAQQARNDYEIHATAQALSDVAQQRRQNAAEIAINDHITSEVDRRMQAASDWQPDRKNMLGFGAGRGLAAAVALIAGGWMQGRGMTPNNQFMPLVLKMIDDDVNDQVRKNSANIQMLREQKGDLKAAASELKKRQLMLVDSELAAKVAANKANDPSVQAALQAYKSDSAAKQAAWDADQRKALERTVTEQVTKATNTQTTTGGPTKKPEERNEAQAKAEAASNALDRLAEKAGFIKNPKTGQYEAGKHAINPLLLEQINPFSEREGIAAFDAAVEAYGRQQSGGVIGDREREAFEEQLGAGKSNAWQYTPDKMIARLNAARVNIDAKLKSDDAAERQKRVVVPENWR